MQINSEVKNYKSQETAKANEPKQCQVYTFNMYYIDFISWHFFFRNRCYRKMTLLQNIYFHLRSHWEKFCLSFIVFTFFAAKDSKDINLYRFHMLFFLLSSQYLDIPSASCIKFKEIRKNYHTSFGTFLMHFWCTFPFFYILLIVQKSTKKLRKISWISKIAKLVKLLALET